MNEYKCENCGRFMSRDEVFDCEEFSDDCMEDMGMWCNKCLGREEDG